MNNLLKFDPEPFDFEASGFGKETLGHEEEMEDELESRRGGGRGSRGAMQRSSNAPRASRMAYAASGTQGQGQRWQGNRQWPGKR